MYSLSWHNPSAALFTLVSIHVYSMLYYPPVTLSVYDTPIGKLVSLCLSFSFFQCPYRLYSAKIVIFSYCKILTKLFGNYSLWEVSDYIINKSLRNLLGCKVLGLCHFEPFCPFNVLSYFLHDLFSPGGYLYMSIIPK